MPTEQIDQINEGDNDSSLTENATEVNIVAGALLGLSAGAPSQQASGSDVDNADNTTARVGINNGTSTTNEGGATAATDNTTAVVEVQPLTTEEKLKKLLSHLPLSIISQDEIQIGKEKHKLEVPISLTNFDSGEEAVNLLGLEFYDSDQIPPILGCTSFCCCAAVPRWEVEGLVWSI